MSIKAATLTSPVNPIDPLDIDGRLLALLVAVVEEQSITRAAEALARVWKAQRFSWWMTMRLHTFPDNIACSDAAGRSGGQASCCSSWCSTR